MILYKNPAVLSYEVQRVQPEITSALPHHNLDAKIEQERVLGKLGVNPDALAESLPWESDITKKTKEHLCKVEIL